MTRFIKTLTILLTISISVYAQKDSGVLNVLQKVTKFTSLFPQEKVYLHFDNTGYFKGETIWYKAYLTSFGINTKSELRNPRGSNGSNSSNDNNTNNSYFVTRNSDLSKVLYVELVSPGGDVLEVQKLHVDDEGGAWGQFRLDSILGTGFYEVRAYTRYMLNWGVNAMFSRVFPVFEAPPSYGDYSRPTISKTLYKDRNPNMRMADSLYLAAAKDGIYTDDDPKKISAHFYPEGGDLVQGLRSRVAVMVIDDNGATYQGRGDIVNGKGEKICSVETDSTGRGIFEITPTGEKLWMSMQNYRKRRNIQKFPLPDVKAEGTVMHLDVVSDDIVATIRSVIPASSPEGNGSSIGYAVMHDGNIVACDTMTLSPLIELELDRDNLPGGVNQITVFNPEGRILCERLFWIYPRPERSDSILVTPVSKGLGQCSEVELTVKTKPNTTFSFSALDYGSMTGWKSGNARTWMLLSSDVKGYIDNVDYYFESDDMEHREAADMLMLVQGWRRYDWELMSGLKWFEDPQPVEDGLYLYGKLGDYRKKNPVRNVEIDTYIYNQQGQNLHGTTHTDSLGNYIFKVPDVSGEWALQMFTKIDDKRKTFYVGIDRQFAPMPRFITPNETKLIQKGKANLFGNNTNELSAKDNDSQLNYAEKVHVIPQVTVKAKKKFFSNDNIQWYNQREGRHWATVYYNAQQELDKILDRGDAMPTTFEFLARRNPMFNNAEAFDLPRKAMMGRDRDDANMDEIWEGHMSYGGRKIRWIIDNGLATYISDEGHFFRQVGNNPFDDVIEFPYWMDEVKAIYIQPYSPKEEETSVRIYVYRQQKFTTESQKGLRRTHFQGYNVPETFTMEDLRVLPPLENLRRTLYWEPNVKTDENGEAKIIFYNNLSATQIQYSAEGISKDGKVIVGE